jgi:hypothetical protein
MQTHGTLLFVVELRSLACVRLAAHDGRSVLRFLYFALDGPSAFQEDVWVHASPPQST